MFTAITATHTLRIGRFYWIFNLFHCLFWPKTRAPLFESTEPKRKKTKQQTFNENEKLWRFLNNSGEIAKERKWKRRANERRHVSFTMQSRPNVWSDGARCARRNIGIIFTLNSDVYLFRKYLPMSRFNNRSIGCERDRPHILWPFIFRKWVLIDICRCDVRVLCVL